MATQTHEGTAAIEGPLWSERAQDWATVHEHNMKPAYTAVLDLVHAAPGMSILEVGCGGGTALRLAADRGADVTAIDAAEVFVELARRRVPGADVRVGDLQFLPYDDETFDAVVGFNSLQYAADPEEALREAHRVLRPGGRVGVLVWGPDEEGELRAHFENVRALVPPAPAAAPGALSCSQPGTLPQAVRSAGFEIEIVGDVAAAFAYPNQEVALRALSSSGPCVSIARAVGDGAVAQAILDGIAPYRRGDGSFRMRSEWRFVIGRKD